MTGVETAALAAGLGSTATASTATALTAAGVSSSLGPAAMMAAYGSSAASVGAVSSMAATTGTGFFASVLSGVSAFDMLMLGSTALSTGSGFISGMNEKAYQEGMFDYNQAVGAMEAAKREEQRQSQLNETLAAQRVMWGAAGIDISSGSPETVYKETIKQAERETNADRGMVAVNSMGAALKKKSASNSMTSSTLGVMGGASENLLDWSLTRKKLG